MRLYFNLYFRQIFTSALIGILVLWAISASVVAMKKEIQFKILYVSQDNIQVLQENEEKLDNIFLQNFIFTYISYCYNYDKARFIANVSKCGDFMNPKLWASKQTDLKDAFASITKEKYTLATVIDGTPQILPNGNIQIDARSTKTTEVGQSSLKVRITLEIKKVPFYKENMTHYEVQSAKEEPI